jgi:hypothetical protein
MTVNELGSLGELIAAIATIATLVYLALQIRQNTSLLRLSETRGIQDDADRWRALLIEHKEVAHIYRRGLTDPDSLDADDRLRFRMLQDQLFYSWQAIFMQSPNHSQLPPSYIKGTFSQPGGRQYWQKSRHLFREDFVAYVEGLGD